MFCILLHRQLFLKNLLLILVKGKKHISVVFVFDVLCVVIIFSIVNVYIVSLFLALSFVGFIFGLCCVLLGYLLIPLLLVSSKLQLHCSVLF